MGFWGFGDPKTPKPRLQTGLINLIYVAVPEQ